MELTVNGKSVDPARVFKLKRGAEPAATKAAMSNGVDDMFFRIGDDNYVASGKFPFLTSTSLGKEVVIGGRPAGVLTAYDRDASDKKKHIAAFAFSAGIIALGAYVRNAGLITLGTLAALFAGSRLGDRQNPDLLRVHADETLR